MRSVKVAVAAALAGDEVITRLVTCGQIFATERATLPILPAIEIVAVDSTPQETGPLVKHLMSVEVTVANVTEDGADETLDAIVAAVRRRLLDAAIGSSPIALPDGSLVVCELQGTRWSISAGGPSGVIRGAAIALAVGADE